MALFEIERKTRANIGLAFFALPVSVYGVQLAANSLGYTAVAAACSSAMMYAGWGVLTGVAAFGLYIWAQKLCDLNGYSANVSGAISIFSGVMVTLTCAASFCLTAELTTAQIVGSAVAAGLAIIVERDSIVKNGLLFSYS
jgi:hypothetical protein